MLLPLFILKLKYTWLATPATFSCYLGRNSCVSPVWNSTCGQYCSSQSMGGSNAEGGWNYLCLVVEDIGPCDSLLN